MKTRFPPAMGVINPNPLSSFHDVIFPLVRMWLLFFGKQVRYGLLSGYREVREPIINCSQASSCLVPLHLVNLEQSKKLLPVLPRLAVLTTIRLPHEGHEELLSTVSTFFFVWTSPISRISSAPSTSSIGLPRANSMASRVKLPEHVIIPPVAFSAVTTPNSSLTTGTLAALTLQFS
jgi:hypothetical protein